MAVREIARSREEDASAQPEISRLPRFARRRRLLLRERPNLVLIIGDDLAYRDLGFMGSEIVRTPNLDRLAREGTVFRNAQVTASLCKPSLRTLLTGLHPYQWNLRIEELEQLGTGPRRGYEIEAFDTLPALLAGGGYLSFQAGKFFEKNFAVAGFTHGMERPTGEASPIGRSTMKPVYDFIDENVDRPFFLWFAPALPHVPHDAPATYRALYEDRGFSEGAIGYYANITRFDDVVRNLVDHLDAKRLRERTLVVYLADNGWDQASSTNHFSIPGGGPKGKASLHSLGFRTPVIFRWPGQIRAGVVEDALVSSVDLVPTLLDYAGVETPPDLPGRSLRGLLEGGQGRGSEYLVGSADKVRVARGRPKLGDAAHWSDESAFFVHTPEWRYILYADQEREELYDLRVDPEENHDVAPEHPVLAAMFRAKISDWKREMRRPLESP
jgi:uncharacterized sulfatase